MKTFIRYFITQIWALIGLGLCYYVFFYPIVENKYLSVRTNVIYVGVACMCAFIYTKMVSWINMKESG